MTAHAAHTPRDEPVPLKVLAAASQLLADRDEHATAVLAVALPVGALVGVDASCTDGEMRWRDGTVAVGAEPAEAAAELVAAGRRPGDRWVWPEGTDVQHWVRFVRSGSRVVAWGARTLLGGPRVTFDPAVDVEARRAVLAAVADSVRSGQTLAPAVLDTGTGTVLVEGTDRWCHVSASAGRDPYHYDTAAPLAVRLAAAELVRNVAGAGVAHVVEREDPDRFEVQAVLPTGHRITVPVTVLGSAVSLGAKAACVGDGTVDVPGWAHAGAAEDGTPVITRGGLHALAR